ncbi:MAG: hypothetical protein J6S75_04020, partial [Thermoguttaceae bacterium]|nr:hypothetical protein [Thermoguttaceae bacterium]
MLFSRSTVDVLRTKSPARKSAPRRHRTLRFESLERRELLTATVNDFAGLKAAIELGQDSDIELGSDIVIDSTYADATITLSTGTFNINGHGNKITVGTNVTRGASLFTVSNGSLTLSNLTISGFNYVGGYGGVFQQTGGTITIDSGTTITNCGAYNGAVADIDRGTFIVSGATFSGNTAANNGGVVDLEMGTLIINSGTFSNNTANTAAGSGGVVSADTQFAEVAINNGLFTGNSAYIGGVAYVNSGKISIADGTFSGNSASFEGGVIATTTQFSEVTIEDGDFMTLLGPSGCGKTTTLR